MPPRPTSRALAEDFLRWRAKHHRPRRSSAKRKPSARWSRMAEQAASEASSFTVLVAANLGGLHV